MAVPLTVAVCQSSKHKTKRPQSCMWARPMCSQEANIINKVRKWRYWMSRWHLHLSDSLVPTNNDFTNAYGKLKMLDSIKWHSSCCKPSNIGYAYMVTLLRKSFSVTGTTCGP